MDISLLLSSVSGAVELGKLLVNERDRQKAGVIQTDLTEKLIQAQSQISEVLAAIIEKDGRIQALTEQVRSLEATQNERSRYELAKVGSLGEFFAYRLRPSSELTDRQNEPMHYLCQPCFDDGKKSVLQLNGLLAMCSVCGRNARIEPLPPSSRPIRTGYSPLG